MALVVGSSCLILLLPGFTLVPPEAHCSWGAAESSFVSGVLLVTNLVLTILRNSSGCLLVGQFADFVRTWVEQACVRTLCAPCVRSVCVLCGGEVVDWLL